MVKKCSKRTGDSDADSDEDGADRFARLTSFGSQELRKEARSKTLSEMKLQSELTRLRNTQNDRKVKTKCELSLQFNMALDKETELLVNSAEIEDEKDKVLTADQLRNLREVDIFSVNRLRGLQEELECISSCLLMKADGNKDMASIKMKMFVEDKAGKVRDERSADLDRLGVQVNWKKSVLTPSKCTRFLGMLVDSELYRSFVPPEEVVKLRAIVEDMVAKEDASVRELASVVGKVMSMQVAVPAVRRMTAECYGLIRPDGDWDRTVRLTEAVLHELLQVVDWVSHFNRFGNPIRRCVAMEEVRVALDAGTGDGWRIDGRVRSLGFDSPALATAADWKPDEKQEWQPWNELLAVKKCLIEEAGRLAGLTVLVRPVFSLRNH